MAGKLNGLEIHSLSKSILSGLLLSWNDRIVHQMLILNTLDRDIDNIFISSHFFGEVSAFQTGLKYDVGFVPVFLVKVDDVFKSIMRSFHGDK